MLLCFLFGFDIVNVGVAHLVLRESMRNVVLTTNLLWWASVTVCTAVVTARLVLQESFHNFSESVWPAPSLLRQEEGRNMVVDSSSWAKRKPTSMHEVLGATLQTLEFGGPVWKGKNLYLLNSTVSIFLDPEKVLCGKSNLLRHAKFSDLLSFLNQDQLFCSPKFPSKCGPLNCFPPAKSLTFKDSLHLIPISLYTEISPCMILISVSTLFDYLIPKPSWSYFTKS